MMLKARIKDALPSAILNIARILRRPARHVRKVADRRLRAHKAPLLHRYLVKAHRGKRPIRVMFLISNTASWKVGPVFSQMLSDPEFDPVAIVCPVVSGMLSRDAQKAANLCAQLLRENGFPFIDMTKMGRTAARRRIDEIDPHVVFFTNPHGLAPKHLHDELLSTRLTCYVPYNHEVMTYGGNQQQYNSKTHNSFWRVFVPHQESKDCYKTARIRSDAGVLVTGFPACEPLLAPDYSSDQSPWKKQKKPKKRVIYAPHWLWNEKIKMATIDTFGESIMRLADKYRDDIQWALRPHPMLWPKLTQDECWGPEKSEAFFSFWQNSDFCQIHDEDYVPLFRTSNAIIHDSGSFLAEYLYLKKPAMYLVTEQTGVKYFNPFGRRAVAACTVGRSVDDIERFLIDVLEDTENVDTIETFFKQDIKPLFQQPPSVQICEEIKKSLN